MDRTTFRSKRSRRGLTLVEVALSLGVLALIMVGLAQILTTGAEYLRSRGVADRLAQVQDASRQYVETHYSQLLTLPALAGGGTLEVPITGAVGPGAGLQSVQAAGFLPTGFADTNAYGQNHALLLRRIGTGQRVEGIVTTYGGTSIPDRILGQIGGFVGADGGFMFNSPVIGTTDTTGVITGVGGGWSASATTWTANAARAPAPGHLMASFAFAEGALVGDYLNRHNIGIAEANTMRTDLNMGNQDIVATQTVQGNGGTITMGTEVLIDPSLRVTGYITAGTTVTAGVDVNAGRDVTAKRNVVAEQESYGQRFVDRNDPSFFVDPNAQSNLRTIYNVDAQFLNTNARIHTGAIGGNVRLRDRLPNYVAKQGWVVNGSGQSVPKPSCPGNGQPKITYSSISDSYWFASNVQYDPSYSSSGGQYVPNLQNNEVAIARKYTVNDHGSTWSVHSTGTPLYNGVFSGLAMTYCYYPD